jgi:NAD(P)H-hydrate repair Nnr-like enzyme with NAD(P)H-hydrate epimerase domain
MKDGKLTMSRFKMEGETPVREAGKKRDVPIVCGTGENKKDAVLALAKFVDRTGAGVPADVAKTNKETWCIYSELLLRTQMQDPDPKVVWYTPEEMETILSAKPKTKKGK